MPLVLQSQHTLIPNTSVVVPKDNTFHLGDNECGPCTPPHSPNPQTTLASKDAPSHNDTTAAPTTPPPSRSNTYNKRPALKQDNSTKYYTADDLRNLSVQEQTTSHTNELASNEADPALRATVLNGPSTQPDTNVPSTRHAEMETTNRDILHPLEYVNSIDNGLLEHHNNSSTLSKSYSYQRRSSLHSRALHRRSTTMAIENLDPDERAALEAEIAARRAARRASQRKRKTYADTDDEDDKVVIGVRIGEGHQNYQLMYDMLTGIRVAVSRVSAKINRPLADEDFKAAHKLVFDVTGNELTPGVKYDFKFKDYAPWVFRNLREKFHVDAADYLMSLTNKYILSELTSPGKSGSFFYYSRDYRFIIKTIHYTEHRFLRKVLKDYYEHVCQNPNTLLSRFYGLHRIKLPHGSKIHFIVMGNVFPANKDIHTSFDLKGSTFGRLTPEEKRKNKHAVLKDQNWLEQKERLQLGPTKRRIFLEQLEKDVKLLIRLNIMDYSLLIGIHDTRRGNSENIRDNHLQVVEPNAERLERQLSVAGTIRKESRANIVRKALKQASPVQLDTSELPGTPGEERRYCYFYAEDGGLKATDEDDRETLLLYFLGVIDILTPYNFKKKIEHLWKSLTQDKHTISSVPADEYGERFLQFMRDAVEPKPKSS